MTSLRHSYTERYLLISITYLLFLYLLYQYGGIVTTNEAEKYILASQEFLKSNVSYTFEHHLFYSSYVFFVTPFYAIGGITGVVIAQIVFNMLAASCIKKSIDLILPGNKVSFWGALIFLFSYPIQYWTLTLFSDNFFVCLISICLYYTLKKKTSREIILWLFLLIIQIFTRPPGIFLSTAFGFYYLYTTKIFSTSRIWVLAIITLGVIFSLLFYIPVETKAYIKPIAGGAIIVDMPDYNIPKFNKIEKSSLGNAYRYLIDKIGLGGVIKLYFKKLLSFFTLTRAYYSTLHNAVLTTHYLLYILAIIGAISVFKKNERIVILGICAISLTANLVGLTYNEWHYRFTLAIFPFLIIFAVAGVDFFCKKDKNYFIFQQKKS